MKKYIKSALVAAIVAVSGYNVYQSQSVMNGMSEFALANVEALARNENEKNYEEVYYPVPGDPNYGYTKCVCWGTGDAICC